MSTVQISGLNVVSIYVSDLERAKAFYEQHLGFEDTGEEMPPGILMRAGDVMIYLEGGRQPRKVSDQSEAEVAVCFSTVRNSVHKVCDLLSAAGVKIAYPYREFTSHFAMFRITDPDGNLIEFAGHP